MFKEDNFFKKFKKYSCYQGSYNMLGIPQTTNVDVELPLTKLIPVEDSCYHPYWSQNG